MVKVEPMGKHTRVVVGVMQVFECAGRAGSVSEDVPKPEPERATEVFDE